MAADRRNALMDKHREEVEQMTLPFNFRYIPIDYPQPECFMKLETIWT